MASTTDQTRAVAVTIGGPATLRRDRWWVAPLITVVVLGGFTIYGSWAAIVNRDYYVRPYLSPFYSPCLATSCHHATVKLVGSWWHFSPALLILPFPLSFRLTCYYYRKAYYRAFWLSPPACAVPDGHQSYGGETRFPLIFQNAHRYAFYAAGIISLINTWDAVLAFHSPEGFGFGLGNVILWVNVIMLWAYTLSCHSCRHIAGGRLKHFSKHPVRYRFWTFVSKLNTRHMQLAWITLGTLAFTDFYIMALSAGWFGDLRFIN
jgi:hypothetical protein